MTQNEHITHGARHLSDALKTIMALGLTVARATIGNRNPVIELAEPPRRKLDGVTLVRRFDGARTVRRKVALVDGCQVEWEV